MERKCLECNTIIYGRSDKKYCSDSCRNSRNNRLNSEVNKTIRKTNQKLRKNYSILLELRSEGINNIKKIDLLELGFYLNYFTHTQIDENKKACFYIYDLGYFKQNNMYFIIEKETSTKLL